MPQKIPECFVTFQMVVESGVQKNEICIFFLLFEDWEEGGDVSKP